MCNLSAQQALTDVFGVAAIIVAQARDHALLDILTNVCVQITRMDLYM